MLVSLEGWEDNLNGRQKKRKGVGRTIFSSGSYGNDGVAFLGIGLDGFEDDLLGKFKIKKAVKKAVPKPLARVVKKAVPAPLKTVMKQALKVPVIPTPANLKKMANTVIKVSNNPIVKAVASVYPPAGMALKMINQADMISKDPMALLNIAEQATGRELVPDEVKAIMETKALLDKGAEVSNQIDAGEAPVMSVNQTESLSARVDNTLSQPAYQNLNTSEEMAPDEKTVPKDLRTRAEKYYDAGILK
jgi:hypothetical protein